VRDDLLGIWGESSVTGKPAADDIRRRKKSLPIVMIASEAVPEDLADLRAIYTQDDLDEADVARVLTLLDRYEVRERVQEAVDRYHDEARSLLTEAAPPSPAREQLAALAERLATRAF
jgi:geranylgeranyl diphosphate synthase type I